MYPFKIDGDSSKYSFSVALNESSTLFTPPTQGVINMYKVILGLEVLGNPVGFVKGLKQGAVGLFYQPFEVLLNEYSHECLLKP